MTLPQNPALSTHAANGLTTLAPYATMWVDYTAGAWGDGSVGNPYNTLQAALDAIGANSTIAVLGRPAAPENVNVPRTCTVIALQGRLSDVYGGSVLSGVWENLAHIGNATVAAGVAFTSVGVDYDPTGLLTIGAGGYAAIKGAVLGGVTGGAGSFLQTEAVVVNDPVTVDALLCKDTYFNTDTLNVAGVLAAFSNTTFSGGNLTFTGAPGVAQVDANSRYQQVTSALAVVNGAFSIVSQVV